MKIDRLIGILTTLLHQGKTTAPELARRFEVSRRTINRDLEELCKAGIPIVTTQGYGGGISIADSYRLDRSLLTDEELQDILAGLRGMQSISNNPNFNILLEKLFAKDRISMGDPILINLTAFDGSLLPEKIDTIKQAIQERHLISFRYCYQKGDCQRTIEPYRLVFQWSSWYVLGYCLDRNDFRLFKLNRLWELHSGDSFAARDIPLQVLEFNRHFHTGALHLKALFSISVKYRLIEEYGVNCYSPAPDGRLLLERNFASYENMREWILSFGDQAEVLEPEALREDLRRQAENLIKKYRGT